MYWWQWLLIVLALGFVGVLLAGLPDFLRYLKISRM